MPRSPLAPVAAALAFVDAINGADIDRLAHLLSDDHQLVVFDEEPLAGKAANVEAWQGYFDAFPAYVIYPHRIAGREQRVVIVGHTTGSHLGLPDEEEAAQTLIWVAAVEAGRLREWRLVPDDDEHRHQLGIDD